MTGNLDKPLGQPKPQRSASPAKFRFISVAVIALAAGGVGFAFKDLVGFPKIREPATQEPTNTTSNPGQPVKNPSKGSFAKRLNLPIDDTAPGLQEITIASQDDIPKVIPRRRPPNIVKKQVLAHLPDPELIEKRNGVSLPIISPDGLRPLDVYARLPDTEGNFGVARIVIILGGLGISQSSTQQAVERLPAGVTLAFAPYGNSLTRWMRVARKKGHEILLQIPMEPFGYPQSNAGDQSLLSSFTTEQNQTKLHWSLGRFTNYVGVMNFLGGKMLTHPDSLSPIFRELSERGLMFVDNGAIRNSMASSIAKSNDLPFTRAQMTIDSLRTRKAIATNLKNLEEQAKRTGLAIGVASAFPDTISQIAKFLKDAKRRGLELTPVSAIASKPKG